MAANLVPAAQYLRMATEHQQYSLENQSTAIQKYADAHGFEIVRTYSDVAKSGVALKRRAGLRQLLQDVVSGNTGFRAILVYDVSRWGRFQDTDESAHYEFVCKSAGVPVHYCAETFANDGSLPSLIMKALKRTMAGELVARHLKTTEDLHDSRSSPRTESLVASAVQWAQRIMRRIDAEFGNSAPK